MALESTSARLANFGCVVERYQSLVWSVAYAASGDASLSDDIVQETFLAAWKQQQDLRDLSKMRAYVASIARNLAITATQRSNRMDGAAEEAVHRSAPPTPLESLLKAEQSAQAKRALSAIPKASREAFVLFYQEGHSVSRVAVDLGLSESTVKQRLYRARESLKESVALQLSMIVKYRTRGKAVIATIVALIASQTELATAAATAAKGATQPSPLVLGVGSATSLLGSAAAKLFIVASTLGIGLVFWMHNEVEASEDSSLSLAPIVAAQEPMQPVSLPLPPRVPRREPAQPSPDPMLQVPDRVILLLSEQPLITGRIFQRSADADADLDGRLSEEELADFRERQEHKLLVLIRNNWGNRERTVTCSSVGFDDEGVYERSAEFDIRGYRDGYAQFGTGQSVDDWISNQLAASESGTRLCYQVGDRFTDEVREARANHETLKWQAVVEEEFGRIWIEVPKPLLGELANANDKESVAKIATKWGTQLVGAGISLLGEPGQSPLHPLIRHAIDEGMGGMWMQYR